MSDDVERQFAEVQRLAHLGSWEWDVAEDRITWSDELYRIYGLEPQSFPATYDAFLERIHPDDRAMVDATVQAAYGSHQPYSFDHRLVRPDGSIRWLHGRGRVVAVDGVVQRLYGIAMDVTDQKELQALQREFVENAAHELRTPITAIVSAINVLDDRGPVDGRVLEVLRRNSERLARITESLLDLSVLAGGARTITLEPVRVRDVVVGAARALDMEVDLDVGADLTVEAAHAELERVLVNLLENARRHGGPRVWCQGRETGGEVVLEVIDDGPGVPAELRGRLFAPFAAKEATGGTHGLGLAIVRELMTAFGGDVEHLDRAGGGTVMRLRFSAG